VNSRFGNVAVPGWNTKLVQESKWNIRSARAPHWASRNKVGKAEPMPHVCVTPPT